MGGGGEERVGVMWRVFGNHVRGRAVREELFGGEMKELDLER